MSIGRIQAGFAHATQELTVAAANLNFDFTLMKFEAPAEYQTIGTLLSPKRVREAETGPIHVTARKLGALFEGVCPDTPNLIKAYGIRASEISRDVSEHDQDRSSHNWIRSEFGGIDATSIWAAATSSKAALPIHLLACIIARLWKDSEAVSVWAEIVAERKNEITSTFEEGIQIPLTLASAARQEITRDHLSKWDCSARAWLHTADTSRQRQYKQFLLIVNNLSIAIHQPNISLYQDVINVWKLALVATEGLISGTPHAVRDGPVLLGISAWHIFPDMLVLNGPTGNMNISMEDILVRPGGVLTLGISDPARRENQGVYWSLSLSHHMHYGEAVKRTRRLNIDGSRLTLNELFLVCFGNLFKLWGISKKDINKTFCVLQEVGRVVPESPWEKGVSNWRHVLERAIQSYTAGDTEATLAVSLGRRRPTFLSGRLVDASVPLLGLRKLSTLLSLLKDPDSKIELLRRLAARVQGLSNNNSIILCLHKRRIDGIALEFATAFPYTAGHQETATRPDLGRHHRWTQVPGYILVDHKNFVQNRAPITEDTSHPLESSSTKSIATNSPHSDECRQESLHQKSPSFEKQADKRFVKLCTEYLTARERELRAETVEYLGFDGPETVTKPNNDKNSLFTFNGFPWSYDGPANMVTNNEAEGGNVYYYSNFGQDKETGLSPIESSEEFDCAALYVRYSNTVPPQPDVTLNDILWCFKHDLIDPARLDVLLTETHTFNFLKGLGAISQMYHEPAAGGATISGSIVEKTFDPPNFYCWKDTVTMNQATAIALIGYFETGYSMLETIDTMQGRYNIIGLSSGDSIFVRTSVLNNPETTYPAYSFTRILGNTGKAGFSILTTPSELMVSKLDPAAWRIKPAVFDGTPLDQFSHTSLHLTFTDWQVPLVQSHSVGQRDADVHILEAVVSVRNAGKWVADVDICRALLSTRLVRPVTLPSGKNRVCGHSCDGNAGDSGQGYSSDEDELLSIETWDQVLDEVDGSAVVRCYDNQVARLAIISVLCLHGQGEERPVVICPKTACWKCHAEAETPGQDITYIY
ncbi:hypothetical protein PG984_014644 [Apiospora sp. TS-2023a]